MYMFVYCIVFLVFYVCSVCLIKYLTYILLIYKCNQFELLEPQFLDVATIDFDLNK